jgi:hypothetical protein
MMPALAGRTASSHSLEDAKRAQITATLRETRWVVGERNGGQTRVASNDADLNDAQTRNYRDEIQAREGRNLSREATADSAGSQVVWRA